ncbi:coelenterazine h 2-monooxygenase-like [Ptychodera flava]|uniref:coelenterazine h 2-monooxygenase-like n=1 Tax=Ptychodera flava TaxID=63121 RepID=UPI003969D51F
MNRLSVLQPYRLQGAGSTLQRVLLGFGRLQLLSQVSARNTSYAGGEEWFSKCRKVKVLDSEMNYYDSAPFQQEVKPNAVVFLHGNPTSSFLWRNVLPHVEGVARCLAPDLIGMGKSAKLPSHSYRFVDHYRYLSAWMDSVDLPDKVTIVGNAWGSGLGLHWCHKHQHRVQAIVHMESIAAVFHSWDVVPKPSVSWCDPRTGTERNIFQGMRSENGEDIILKRNMFVEALLPAGIIRDLSKDEMNAYRMPYLDEGEGRRPTLTWARELPIRTEGPQDVVDIVDAFYEWAARSKDIPKLSILARPGFFTSFVEKMIKHWPNNRFVTVKGRLSIPEDCPTEIGLAIKEFLLKDVYKQ